VCGVCGVCGGRGGVGVVGGVRSLLTFDIPQTALVATLNKLSQQLTRHCDFEPCLQIDT
jgi:hypothetical protein